MQILGIETSCDETAASVVTRGSDGNPKLLSNTILSQIDEHSEFGGVVPEIAARAHLSAIDHIIIQALSEADTDLSQIDGIGVTSGPGLVGGLMVDEARYFWPWICAGFFLRYLFIRYILYWGFFGLKILR